MQQLDEVAARIRMLGAQLSSACPSPLSGQPEKGDLIESRS